MAYYKEQDMSVCVNYNCPRSRECRRWQMYIRPEYVDFLRRRIQPKDPMNCRAFVPYVANGCANCAHAYMAAFAEGVATYHYCRADGYNENCDGVGKDCPRFTPKNSQR